VPRKTLPEFRWCELSVVLERFEMFFELLRLMLPIAPFLSTTAQASVVLVLLRLG
jgi:hypothetical protein